MRRRYQTRRMASSASPALVRKQCSFSSRPQQIVYHLREGKALQTEVGGRHREGLRQRVEEQLNGDHKRGNPPHLSGGQPGGHEQPQAGRGYQAPAQVVQNLPAVEPGKLVRPSPAASLGDARQDPIRDLPIATNPTMLPAGVAQVVLRELIIELNITGQAHSNVSAFNQIVAQQPLLRKPCGKHATEGAHIINPFAVVGGFPGQILVNVRDSFRVWVDSNGVREETAERGGTGARQGRAHARLDDRVCASENSACGIEARLVQGVCQGFDHPAGGAVRKLRVAVQRDDEPHVRKTAWVADEYQTSGIFRPRSRRSGD